MHQPSANSMRENSSDRVTQESSGRLKKAIFVKPDKGRLIQISLILLSILLSAITAVLISKVYE